MVAPLLPALAALILLVPAALGGSTQIAVAGMACAGGTAITGVKAEPPMLDGTGVNHYRVAVTVENTSATKQSANTLDSVVMYQQGTKTDVKGLHPLAASASQTVIFTFQRSAEAIHGSTNLRFKVVSAQSSDQDCSASSQAVSTRV
jgi:hypothetical protein